jgi:hypothetical protein
MTRPTPLQLQGHCCVSCAVCRPATPARFAALSPSHYCCCCWVCVHVPGLRASQLRLHANTGFGCCYYTAAAAAAAVPIAAAAVVWVAARLGFMPRVAMHTTVQTKQDWRMPPNMLPAPMQPLSLPLPLYVDPNPTSIYIILLLVYYTIIV